MNSNNNLTYQGSSNGQSNSSTTLPVGLRTPSRVGKRPRYNTDLLSSQGDSGPENSASVLGQSQGQEQEQDQQQRVEEDENREERVSEIRAESNATVISPPSVRTELEEIRQLNKAFETIDQSMTEARDKLKTFYKTADETNTLLDMWIRVLSQTEHTQKLLQDTAWDGYTMEEARYREHQERRAAYHQAMEEANRRHSLNYINHAMSTPSSASISAAGSLSSAATSSPLYNTVRQSGQTLPPLKKSSSAALVAAAHAHASAIAANRKRNAVGVAAGNSSGLTRGSAAGHGTSSSTIK